MRIRGVVFLLLLVSCGVEERRRDVVQPRLVDVQPRDFVLGLNPQFELRFSENMYPEGISNRDITLVRKEDLSEVFLVDFADGKLSQTHQKLTWPIEIKMGSGTRVQVKVLSSLAAGSVYALVLSPSLRDLSGNPLMGVGEVKAPVALYFQTGGAEDRNLRAESLAVPRVEATPDQKYVRVNFDTPLQIPKGQGLQLVLKADAAKRVSLNDTVLSADRKSILLTVQARFDGCMRWLPGTTYELVLSPSMVPVAEIITSTTCENVALKWLGVPKVSSLEKAAQVDVSVNKPAQVLFWYGKSQGSLDCLGHSCPREMGEGNELVLDGVVANEKYRYALSAEDLTGNRIHAQGEWMSEALPKVAVNEVMANPALAKGAPEAEGEYVELYNYSDEPIDLKGYTLEVQTLKTKAVRSCPIAPGAALRILPKGFALLTGQRFLEKYYQSVDAKAIHRMETAQLCGLLSNSENQKITLRDAKMRVVSSYSGYYVSSREGISVERIHADGPDEKANFVFCDEAGATPTKANRAKEKSDGRS